jgi:glycosyltransferase involved in cell wall biosynthesis
MPPPEGGMANQCRQLATLLESESVAVEVIRTNAPYRPVWIGGIRFLRAPARLVPYLLALWVGIGRADTVHLFANSGWAWHLFAAPAILVSRIRGRPIIVNYRGGGAAEFVERAPRRVLRALEAANSVVVPSGYLRDVFERFGVAARIIPNIIDLQRFHPGTRTRSAHAPHIVVTRNLEAIYDVETAVRALSLLRRRVPEARMTIAGTGPEREKLQRLVASLHLGEAVRFAGRMDNADVADLYRSADAMLNPSLVDNMPISVLEAFASGVPVVSTNVGGVPFIAQDERNALLVPPSDPPGCAAALERVLTDVALAHRLSREALEDATGYSWLRVRELWLAEYQRVKSQ